MNGVETRDSSGRAVIRVTADWIMRLAGSILAALAIAATLASVATWDIARQNRRDLAALGPAVAKNTEARLVGQQVTTDDLREARDDILDSVTTALSASTAAVLELQRTTGIINEKLSRIEEKVSRLESEQERLRDGRP